jgi:hypothetical protein
MGIGLGVVTLLTVYYLLNQEVSEEGSYAEGRGQKNCSCSVGFEPTLIARHQID